LTVRHPYEDDIIVPQALGDTIVGTPNLGGFTILDFVAMSFEGYRKLIVDEDGKIDRLLLSK
jgi:hypothetical protein